MISVLTVLTTLYANSLWMLTTSMPTALLAYAIVFMQIALTHKGQAVLWVTNGCTSMSDPITTQSTPMGVDNNEWSIATREYPTVVFSTLAEWHPEIVTEINMKP